LFGLMGTVLGWLGYQVGQRTDAANASGSLHAKVKDIADNKIGDNLDKFKDKVSMFTVSNYVQRGDYYVVCDVTGAGYLTSIFNLIEGIPQVRYRLKIRITIDGALKFDDYIARLYNNDSDRYAYEYGSLSMSLNLRFNTSMKVEKYLDADNNANTVVHAVAYLLD